LEELLPVADSSTVEVDTFDASPLDAIEKPLDGHTPLDSDDEKSFLPKSF